MGRLIEHELLAPDGRHLAIIAQGRARTGETIHRFIRRQNWYLHLPTRCFLNGEVIPPSKLRAHRIRRGDDVRIVSRPGRGGGSGASTAKSIGAIVALVSLSILAPWAGGVLAGALLPAGMATAGAGLFSGMTLAGDSILLEPET